MGLSSLLFGGLTLLQGRNGSGTLDEHEVPALTVREAFLQGLSLVMTNVHNQMAGIASLFFPGDPQTLVTGLLIITLIFTIAYSTKPSDASFQSYLTDLSLHQHLRHIRDQSRRSASPTNQPNPALPAEGKGKGSSEGAANDVSAIDTATGEDWDPDQTYPHVLTFANRISVSLRTPPYIRHDYALFSIVMVAHPAIACPNLFPARGNLKKVNAAKACTKCAAPDASIHHSRTSWYVGAFGTWWTGAKDIRDKASIQDVKGQHHAHPAEPQWGVLDMRSGGDKKKRRRVSPQNERSLLRDGPTEDSQSTGTALSSTAKPARRKKQPHRLRTSQIPAQAPPRSSVLAQQQQRKTVVDDTVRCRPEAVTQHDDSPANEVEACGTPSPRSASADRSTVESPSSAIDPLNAAAEAAVDDLRSQLSSLKTSSEGTRQQLQSQLEDLRSRKRDEDIARSDLRGRMKTLDEGKRTAEAAKRDAERKLKTAQAVKENLEKRILSAEAALENFGDRQTQADQRVKDELQNGQNRRTEIETERLAKLQSTEDAEKNLETLRTKIASLEQRVCEEQKNLKAAEQSLRERSYARAQQAAAAAAAAAAASGGVSHSFSRSGHGSSDALHLMSNGYGPGDSFLFGQTRSVSDSVPASAPYDDGRNAIFEDFHRSSPTHGHFPHQQSSRRISQDFGGSGIGGTGIHGSDAPFQPFGGLQPYSDHPQSLEAPAHASVFPRGSPSAGGAVRASQMLHPRNQQDAVGPFSPNQANGNLQAHMMPPVSPFSTDLLPSNLFASTDDDDTHPGVMPGTRSEAIEAALGRFGLDTSDQSDADGTQSDKDVVDAVLERALGPLSEHESEEETQAAAKTTSARSWWGTNKARQLGKERQTDSTDSTVGASQGDSDSDGEAVEPGAAKQQRKTFGSFPRLSLNQLNPSAKVFRSASRKQADADALKGLNREGFGSQGYLGSTATVGRPVDWSTPSLGDHSSNSSLHGHGPNSSGVSFDAVRRAFEASNPPDDEEGRRSWSAFDQWSQRQGFQPTASRMNGAARGLGGAASQQNPAAAPRSISGGTRRSAGPGTMDSNQDGFQVWPEDLFSPLNRTASSHSAGASIGSSVPSSSQQDASPLAPRDRPTNRSRFAFWSQNSKASLNSAGSAASDQQLSSSAGGGANNNGLPTSSIASGASSGSPSQSTEGEGKGDHAPASASKPKRSFRWSRRSQTANSQASAASDADADEE
ncbi:hypothetical protein BCV69DRAFT_133951 [Microstroma glucosiphilum]|uniref:Uncharacterized protein n=1 Tax=Pseudomicrostroma glucosiphilum TaxID=1684307 RepID=A0A316UAA3_9BASI|nr:hypothetical protein BCV69DRAFT_133951 [Pseudomicrostroma glucosiphilum]PWN22136.1 hypothetical protein BCV69DRAFT_133951 [Pseudomicrostroma glucosiphilum]